MEDSGGVRGRRAMRSLASALLTLSLLLSSTAEGAAGCPPVAESTGPCQCTTRAEEVQIWCGGSDLPSLLSGLASVGSQTSRPIDELILENNVVTALPGRGFAKLRLLRLMLRDNRLERLAASWLAGLEQSLLEVFVVEQELRSLPEDSFEGLLKMEAVTLKAGLVQRLPNFSGLPKLRYLHTELPLLGELVPGRLERLEALEQLHIVGSTLLSSLPESALQDIPRLVVANFSDCGVSWLHPRSLVRLPSLKVLDFSNNRIVDAGQVGRSVRELPHLMVLKLSANRVDMLRETTFVDIPPLTELHLDYNRILEVHRGAFHRLPSLIKLDLSHNQIHRILPEFFLQSYDSVVEELLLMDNQIEHIASIAIVLETLPRLRLLDASENRLEEIGFGALRGHPTLERLHLNSNRLKRVAREAFTSLPSLIELRLSNNSLSNYLEMPLWNLPNLKGLELSENEFRRVDRRLLANLPSLRRLDLSRNSLIVLESTSFLGSQALEHVNLSRNALDTIAPQAFADLSSLFELDLSWNKLSVMVPGLPRALEYLHLSNNKITSLPRSPSPHLLLPALRLLDLSGNRLTQLRPEGLISMPLLQKLYLAENMLMKVDERALDGLGRLEELSLADNRIAEISKMSFRDLRRVEEIDLSGNRLAALESSLFRENSRLKRLYLSRNQISLIPKETFINNKELEEVYLSENGLTTFPPALMEMSRVKVLDLGFNRISGLVEPLGRLKSLVRLRLSGNGIQSLIQGVFAGLENLTVLELESNGLQYVAPHTLRSLPQLTSVSFARNKLISLPSSVFSDLPSLTDVQLQENELTQLASDTFSGTPSLLMLNLSHNQLSSLERAGLHGAKSVELLDLSYNRLTRLSAASLPSLDSLIQLKMDGNKLCTVQGSPFGKMTHLRLLSMRSNRLMSLSETALQPLRSTIYQLDIQDNPVKCSCAPVWLWKEGLGQGGGGGSPRCSDGSSLLLTTISPADCVQPKSSDFRFCDDHSNQALGPGAHSLLHSGSAHSWKEPTSGLTQKPNPEESDYFYEEYVEYDTENSTLPLNNNLTKFVHTTTTAVVIPPNGAPVGSTAIPPAVMSHFISGDTPTLYAKPGNDVKTQPSKSPSSSPQFTFFGMPLPSLSLGKFWGSSRNTDGRPRFPSKAHIEPVRSPSEEGFKPLVPPSGFRPVFTPFGSGSGGSPSSSTGPPPPGRPSTTSLTVLSTPSSAGLPLTPRHPQYFSDSYEVASTRVPVVSGHTPRRPLGGLSLADTGGSSSGGGDVLSESSESQRYTYSNYSSSSRGVLKQQAAHSLFEFNRLEPEEIEVPPPPGSSTTPLIETADRDHLTSPPPPPPYALPSTRSPLIFQDSSQEGNDFVELTEGREPVESQTDRAPSASGGGGGPAPLSTLLAPGGQLPPYSRHSGKPTITKVTVSPPPEAAASQSKPESDGRGQLVGGSRRRGENSERGATNKRTDKSMEWYFANYNKSNLQPYVGPGMAGGGRGSALSSPHPSSLTQLILALAIPLIALM